MTDGHNDVAHGTEIRDSELPDGSEERGYSAQERSRKTVAHTALSVRNAWKARGLHDMAAEGEDGGQVISCPPSPFRPTNTTHGRNVVFSSGLFDWQRNELHRFCSFDPQQDSVLARGTRVVESFAHIGGIRDGFAAYLEDHVASLDEIGRASCRGRVCR